MRNVLLLASVVRLEVLRILDLTLTHVGHPLHRGRMTSVESHKGAALASRLTIRFLVVTEERAKGDLPTTWSLSTLDVFAGSHSPAFGPSDISLRRLHQQGKCGSLLQIPALPLEIRIEINGISLLREQHFESNVS